MSSDDGRVFGVGIGVVFLGLLYLVSLAMCGLYHSSIRAKRVYFITIFWCSFFTIFLIAVPRRGEDDVGITEYVDQTFVLREFMLFFMTLFFAWALLMIPCFHWKERIVAKEISTQHRRT